MTNLLIVAHGSRRSASNRGIIKLARQVALQLPVNMEDVDIGFLEFAQPSVQTSIDKCFQKGAKQLLVLPYFLGAGHHVKEDIPRVISAAKRKWPNKDITLLPHIGAMEAMPNLIAKRCVEELLLHHAHLPAKTSPHYYELGMTNDIQSH